MHKMFLPDCVINYRLLFPTWTLNRSRFSAISLETTFKIKNSQNSFIVYKNNGAVSKNQRMYTLPLIQILSVKTVPLSGITNGQYRGNINTLITADMSSFYPLQLVY